MTLLAETARLLAANRHRLGGTGSGARIRLQPFIVLRLGLAETDDDSAGRPNIGHGAGVALRTWDKSVLLITSLVGLSLSHWVRQLHSRSFRPMYRANDCQTYF